VLVDPWTLPANVIDPDESDAKMLAGKEKREMEQILGREVKRDNKVNADRERMLEERADTLPKDKVKSGADVRSQA
jgi:hypothetical protein